MKWLSLLLIWIWVSPTFAQDVRPIDMVIVLDRSGSMTSTDPEGITAPAAAFIVEQLMLANPENRVAVVAFASDVHILGKKETRSIDGALSSSFSAIIEMLRAGVSQGDFTFSEILPDNKKEFLNLLRSQMKESGYTELGKALEVSAQILGSSNDKRKKMIVLISDGEPFPNINVGLASLFGRQLVQRAIEEQRRGTTGLATRQLVRSYQKYILEKTARNIRAAGIEIYPVAFISEEQRKEPLIDYLKQLKKTITGDEEVIVANRNNLISQLIDFVPSNFNHIQVAKISPLLQGGEEAREWQIQIPEMGTRIRFFFSYEGAKSHQKVQVQIFNNDHLIASSAQHQNFNHLIYNQLEDRHGRIVYQSFQLVGRAFSQGNFKIVMKSYLTRGMPRCTLVVDLNTSIYPQLIFTPSQPTAKEPTEAFLQLKDIESGRTFPLSNLRVIAYGVFPEALQGTSFRVHNLLLTGDSAFFQVSFPETGRYAIAGKIDFRAAPDSDLKLKMHFKDFIEILTEQDLADNVWIAARGQAKAGRDETFKILLPELGEKTGIVFKKVEVRTKLNRILSGLRLEIPPPMQEKSGAELFTGNRNWVSVRPAKIMGLSARRPVPFTIDTEIPPGFVPNIPDGIYKSELRLRAGANMLDVVPLTIKVAIPRFVFSKREINQPFDPIAEHQPVRIEKTIFYPGKMPHPVTIKAWSTTLKGIVANGLLEDKNGILLSENEENNEKTEYVIFKVREPNKFLIPGKNKGSPGNVGVFITLLDPSLNGKTFMNTLYIEGDRHRQAKVILIARVKFISQILLRMISLALFVIGLYLVFLWWEILQDRNCFQHHELNEMVTEGESSNDHLIQCHKREIARFAYDGQNTVTFYHDGHFVVQDRGEFQDQYDTQEGDTISFRTRWGRFKLYIATLPTPENLKIIAQIQESPLGSGNRRYAYLSLGLTLATLSFVGAFIAPYWLLQVLGKWFAW